MTTRGLSRYEAESIWNEHRLTDYVEEYDCPDCVAVHDPDSSLRQTLMNVHEQRGGEWLLCQRHFMNRNTNRRLLAERNEHGMLQTLSGPPAPTYLTLSNHLRQRGTVAEFNALYNGYGHAGQHSYSAAYRPGRRYRMLCNRCAHLQRPDSRDVWMSVRMMMDRFQSPSDAMVEDIVNAWGEYGEDGHYASGECVACFRCGEMCVTAWNHGHACNCPSRNRWDDDCRDCHDYDSCEGHCDFDCECGDYCDRCERYEDDDCDDSMDGTCRWCGTNVCENSTYAWCDGSTFVLNLTPRVTTHA